MKCVIQENVALAQYTTFKIGGPARYFCVVTDEDDLVYAVSFSKKNNLRTLVLGGGSNILISDQGFDGLVIKIEIEKKLKVKSAKLKIGTQQDLYKVTVGSGMAWDDFVAQTVEQGLYGVENLSAIPGTVGAAPVQNIGAYGVEVGDVVSGVRALDTTTMEYIELTKEQCMFGYRDSIFKHHKGRYIITRVDFVLKRNGVVNTTYKDLKEYFGKKGDRTNGETYTSADVREAVIDIRRNKLPDWNLWGTAGSFFKNPVVSKNTFDELKKTYPDMPGFVEVDDASRIKIPLGWVLDKICQVKGLQKGNAMVYEKQALVLVTKPGATATEVKELAYELMQCVKDKTGIEVEGEVEWVN
ncbi:MAG: UDP-N-acetylmuramate dehydrogenase [Candidatus Taylorbacteria bacterium]